MDKPCRFAIDRNPQGDPRLGHGWTEDTNPVPADVPLWLLWPAPREGWWSTRKEPR